MTKKDTKKAAPKKTDVAKKEVKKTEVKKTEALDKNENIVFSRRMSSEHKMNKPTAE